MTTAPVRTEGLSKRDGTVNALQDSTRLLRGEEESGRWDLLLAGQTTPRRAASLALAGLAVGALALWAVTAVTSTLTGQYSKVNIGAGPMLYFSVAQVATAVMFLAVGALTSQLAATRRQAVPAVHPNWSVNGVMIVLGAAGAIAGGIAFQHRDVQGE
jgi:hypothetical protein